MDNKEKPENWGGSSSPDSNSYNSFIDNIKRCYGFEVENEIKKVMLLK